MKFQRLWTVQQIRKIEIVAKTTLSLVNVKMIDDDFSIIEQNLCTPDSDEDQRGIDGAITVQQVCYSVGHQLKLTMSEL